MKSLRTLLFSSFARSTVAVLAVALAGAAAISMHAASEEKRRFILGLGDLIGAHVAPSLKLSDYGETQRLLAIASRYPGITVGVLTPSSELLLADYSERNFLTDGLTDGVMRAVLERGCQGLEGAASNSSRVGCREVSGHLGWVLIRYEALAGLPVGPVSLLAALLIASILGAVAIFRARIESIVLKPLDELTAAMVRRSESPLEARDDLRMEADAVEYHRLRSAFARLMNAVVDQYQERRRAESKLARQDLARQVSHDLRSPLAALGALAHALDELPEDLRVLLRTSISRIRDIANTLLESSRQAHEEQSLGEVASVQFVPAAIEMILSEIRARYRSNHGLALEYCGDSGGPELAPQFAAVQPSDFKRVIANLVNNAVEAIDGPGRVTLSSRIDGGLLRVIIEDTGRGMSADLLERVRSTGGSYGKADGNGMGLSHARRCLALWSGRLEMSSKVGVGTRVEVVLPLAKAPEWFCASIALEPSTEVLVLDDDPGVHQIWDKRLAGRKTRHFSRVSELVDYLDVSSSQDFLLLSDHDLGSGSKTGLELIETLRLGKRAVLVTSYFDDVEIQRRVARSGARLLPKFLADSIELGPLPAHEIGLA